MFLFPPWKVSHGMGSVWNKDSSLGPCPCPGSMAACHPALTLDTLTPQLLPSEPLCLFVQIRLLLVANMNMYGCLVCSSRPDALSLTRLCPPENHRLRAAT